MCRRRHNHELGHALLATDEHPALSYAEEELVVECVAFCVSQTVGLDTSANSVPYLASWAESASVEVLEQTAQLIDRLARRIEDQVLAKRDPEPVEHSPAPAVAA